MDDFWSRSYNSQKCNQWWNISCHNIPVLLAVKSWVEKQQWYIKLSLKTTVSSFFLLIKRVISLGKHSFFLFFSQYNFHTLLFTQDEWWVHIMTAIHIQVSHAFHKNQKSYMKGFLLKKPPKLFQVNTIDSVKLFFPSSHLYMFK